MGLCSSMGSLAAAALAMHLSAPEDAHSISAAQHRRWEKGRGWVKLCAALRAASLGKLSALLLLLDQGLLMRQTLWWVQLIDSAPAVGVPMWGCCSA